MSKDAFYFSHDSNARNDPKILACRSVYGWAGFGMYWAIVEILRDQPNYRLSVNEYLFDALALQLQCDRITAEKFVHDCAEKFTDENGPLLVMDENFLYSKSLIRRMSGLEDKREKARKSAEKRWSNERKNANAMPTQCEGNANPMPKRVKESKDITTTTTDIDKDLKEKSCSSTGEKESEGKGVSASEIPKALSQTYIAKIGTLTLGIAEDLKHIAAEYPEDWILQAMNEASENNVLKLSYVRAILKSWKERGGKNPQKPEPGNDPNKYLNQKYGNMVNR